MPNFERYSIKRAQEAAARMQEKVESGEAKEYSEAEQMVDTESRSETARQEREERAPGEIEINKQKWSEFGQSLKGIVTTLAERESQRMPLVEPGGIGKLAGGVNRLESLVQSGNVKAEDLNTCLQGIATGLRSIGEVRKQGMHEDEDSLTKAYARIRRVRDDIDSVRRAFSGSEDVTASISANMNSLIDATEYAGTRLAKKRQALREYLGR